MKRKLIEWTVFSLIAAGTVFLVRWLLPRAIFRIDVATGKLKLVPRRVDPTLRERLRAEEDRLAEGAPAPVQGPSELPPCLVLPVQEGVGKNPRRGVSGLSRSGPNQLVSPFRDCLELVPGGGPVNAAELCLDTASVMFVQTDLYLPGDPPISFTRVVMPQSRWNWKSQNQIYLPNEYLTYPTGHRNPYTDMTLWLADSRGVLFNRISKGTGYADAVYERTATRSLFHNAMAGWNGNGWDFDLPDGRTIVFPDSYYAQRPQEGALVGLIGPSGASLTFDRDRQGNLHGVRSSDGRWMKLRYQGPIIVSIKDSAGGNAAYAYDEKRRLSRSTNAAGETLSYSYDASGGLKQVENVKTHRRVLSVQYDSHGFPTSIQVDGGPVFRVSAGLDFRDDRGHEWFAKCVKFTDSGCQYEVPTKWSIPLRKDRRHPKAMYHPPRVTLR